MLLEQQLKQGTRWCGHHLDACTLVLANTAYIHPGCLLTNPTTPQVNQYDTYLRGYQAAAIQTERLAALLNAGQSIILSAGLTCVMVAAVLWGPAVEAAEAAMAAAAAAAGSAGGTVAAAAAAGLRAAGSSGVAAARASPGDLVLLQGLLLQLWAPLQFLGWFYR